MRGNRWERIWLWGGVSIPFIYYGNVAISALFYPGYSHLTQYVSELGGPDAARPEIFNVTTIVLGVVGLLAGIGLGSAAARAGSRILPWCIGIAVSLFGVSLVFGGLFPMPDPRHNGFALGLAIPVAPLLLAIALRRERRLRPLTLFLVGTFVVSVGLFLIMSGRGGLVTRENVGLFQRLFTLTVFPWIGIASFVLLKTRPATPGAEGGSSYTRGNSS